jgi:hypothetical protein
MPAPIILLTIASASPGTPITRFKPSSEFAVGMVALGLLIKIGE